MKKLTFIFAIVFSASANAKTLAQVVTAGGLLPRGQCAAYTVQVDDAGLVVSKNCKSEPDQLARLSKEVISKLTQEINSIEISALRKLDQPGCMDAPTISYQISQNGGEFKTIAAWESCQNLEMTNNPQQAKRILDLLRAFEVLSRM